MQWCPNTGRQVSRPTEFYKVAPNICESLVWDVLHVNIDLTFIALANVVKICQEINLRSCIWRETTEFCLKSTS
jgi:hypothetical protein